ncbi:MAG: transporter, partial [Acidimicrobiia bacterium]|nr:transporter [Acidimicrobiia bacterium]
MTLLLDPPEPLAPGRSGAATNRWVTLGVLCLSLMVIVVDNTIVNVALPTLVRELGTSTSQLQWVVDAYTLVFAGLLLTAGSLGDRFGRRGALTAGLLIFGAGSLAASMSNSVNTLVLWRAVMGSGAALIMPATLSILTNVFTDAKERAVAIGVWSGISGLAVALGPVAGGYLLEHFSWGSIFFVNVPIVVTALVAGQLWVPTSRDPHAGRLDLAGAALSIAGLGTLVWTVIEAPHAGWLSGRTLAGGAAAALLLAAFMVRELRTAEPMLDLRFFRNARFSAATGAIMLVSFALFGFIFMITQYFQVVMGWSALSAGVRTLPFAGAVMVTAPIAPKVVERLGSKYVVAAGLFSFAVGLTVASSSGLHTGYTRVWIA